MINIFTINTNGFQDYKNVELDMRLIINSGIAVPCMATYIYAV